MTGTLWDLLGDRLPARAGHVAAIDAGRSITYAGLAGEAGRVAAWLRAAGVAPGERVIVHLRKGIDEVAAMWGATLAGAVVVNVNTQWTPAQLAYVADDCRAVAAILSAPALAALRRVGLPGTVRHWLVQGTGAEGVAARAGLPAAMPAPQPVDPASLAMIIYTSGSTGRPKGVMLSHANIVTGAEAVAEYLGLGEDDRLLSVLPYSFDAGLNQLTTMLLKGGTVVHQPVTMPAEVVRMARDHAVTGIAGVPPLWHQVVRYLLDAPAPLPALRRVTNTGGKIAQAVLERMPEAFPGADIVLMYGLTEAFRSTWLPPARFRAKMGSIGQAIPRAQVFLITPDGRVAGPGEQGELVHAGPLVSMGYWERPEVTAARIRPCPALAPLIGDAPVVWSGDLVRMDADGDLWFVGRMDDMIKTMGFRLSPTEVEDIAAASGLVADVVAFALPDEDRGQAVALAAAFLPGGDAAALMAHCRRAMPPYMVPLHIQPWDGAMPRTASGKLDRPAIIAAARSAIEAPA